MNNSFEIDQQRLEDYLSQNIKEFTGPVTAEKFPGGQSNPTYLLKTPQRQYVLRRKPPGQLLKGAHAVNREFRVLSALHPTSVPVAEPLHLCTDDSVIGSMFYVMQYLDGRVLWDPTLPDSSPTERTAIYREMSRILCALHSVDVDQAGLSDYGSKTGYFERQTQTWTQQYKAAETSHIADIEALIAWLPANQPPPDQRACVTHGDYRLDNLMFHHKRPEVIAILDWELSTIGHPYADLAYQCMLYHLPQSNGLPGLAGQDLASLGIPNEQEYVRWYCDHMGIDEIHNWHFYLVFSLFRLASICQGIEKRRRIGTASSDKAAQYAALVRPLARIALELTNKS